MKPVLTFFVAWFLFSYAVAGSHWSPSDAVWITMWVGLVLTTGLTYWWFTKGKEKKTGSPSPSRHHKEFDEPV